MKRCSILALRLLLSFCLSMTLQAQSLQDILSGSENSESDDEQTQTRSRNVQRSPSNLGTHSLGLGVGQTFLKSDLGRAGEDKITWDLYYNYRASHSFDFVANFHLMKHSWDETWARTSGLALGIKARVFQFDNFSPYVLGGFGFYIPQAKRKIDDEIVKSQSKTTFGWHVGAGAELELNRHFSTGVLLHIHNPFSVQQDFGEPDVKAWYYKLLITGMYSF